MRRLALRAVLLVVLVLPGSAAAAGGFTARLTASYVHAAGAASGTATLTLSAGQVCWKFTLKGLVKPGASGIHKAPPPAGGKSSSTVIPLATTSSKPGCTAVSPVAVINLANHPSLYYVVVADSKHPNGAVGGVLKPA